MLEKLVAKEMFGRLPSEGEMRLDTASVRLRATKVRTSDIGEHTFRDDNGASFHLPADVATRKSCEEGDTVCGMNIVVETWDNEVLGDGIAGPGSHNETNGTENGALASTVTSLTVLDTDANASSIKVDGLHDSEAGAVRIKLKYTPPAIKPADGEVRVVKCVYYDKAKEEFSSDGCTLVEDGKDGEAECRCTHLTDFALWVQLVKEDIAEREWEKCMKDAEKDGLDNEAATARCGPKILSVSDSPIEKWVQLGIAIGNFILVFICLIKLLRFIMPDLYSEGLRSMLITDYQCLMVLVTTAVRGSVALCKHFGVVDNQNLTVSAILFTLPMLFAFWSASLTITNWAKVVHHTVKRGSKSPISGLEVPYFGFNLAIIVSLGVCWAMLVTADDIDTKQVWSKIGQTTLAVPEVTLALGAVVYGSILIFRISESMKTFGKSADDAQKKKQVTACYKTACIMIGFAVLFLCQATIEIIAGWAPDWYFHKVLIGGEAAYAMSPINAAYALCSLLTCLIIVFVTVRLEEVKIAFVDVGNVVAAPLVMLARRISGADKDKLGYDDLDRSTLGCSSSTTLSSQSSADRRSLALQASF